MKRILLLLSVVGVAVPAFAVNVLTNPSFDGNLNGWVAGPGTVYDGTVDATGTPGSGSARNMATVAFASGVVAVSQCVPATPGIYTLGGKFMTPNGQGVNGNGLIRVVWFNGANCTGTQLSNQLITATGTGFITVSTPTIAPPGTVSASIQGENAIGGAGTLTTYFDDFVFDNGLSNVPAVSALGMLLLAAALAASGALFLRRD